MPAFKGREYPEDTDPLEAHTYRYQIGGNTVEDLGWQGHMKIAHEAGMTSREIEVLDSGTDDNGILYAVVKATVVIDGEKRFDAIQAADETTNQVRDPEYVWAVASSRAFKRAVKMALNIYPVDEEVDAERHRAESGPSGRPEPTGGSTSVDEDGNVEIDPPGGYKDDGGDDDGGVTF
jgi:hypothetical protein